MNLSKDTTLTKTCNKCGVTKPLNQFSAETRSKDGRHRSCKDCVNAYNRNYWATQPDEQRKKRQAHIDAQKTAEQRRRYGANTRAKHPETIERNLTKNRLRFLKIRREVIAHYSQHTNSCACCGESHFEFLVIDHIHGGGGQHRKEQKLTGSNRLTNWLQKNNYPEGFRVLCHNCNMCRGAYGYCPHERPDLTPEISRTKRMCSASVNYRFVKTEEPLPTPQQTLFN